LIISDEGWIKVGRKKITVPEETLITCVQALIKDYYPNPIIGYNSINMRILRMVHLNDIVSYDLVDHKPICMQIIAYFESFNSFYAGGKNFVLNID